MTLRNIFAKSGILLSENNTIQIEEYEIAISFDRKTRTLRVSDDEFPEFGYIYEFSTIREAVNHVVKTAQDLLKKSFKDECDRIAYECICQGLPSYGSTYDLQVDDLRDYYETIYARFYA